MRLIHSLALVLGMLITPAVAQDVQRPNANWSVLKDIDSADLAALGWALAGTTGVPAGPDTGLLVTFWQADDGSMVRCVFSLVSPTGARTFETCSLARAVNGDTE